MIGNLGGYREAAFYTAFGAALLRGLLVGRRLGVQGERDGNVSAADAKYRAGTLPICRAQFYPDDAHLSVMLNHDRGIFSELQRLLHA